MNGAFRVAKLDFFTMKSQAVLYAIMVLIIAMFSIMDSSMIVSFITGAWFTALMASNIFVIQEKNNLNRLYGSVSVELKDILLGFSLSLLIFSTIAGIQMPLFFKLGYTKAKMWAVVPFLVVMLLVIIPSFITVLSTFIQSVMSNRSMIIAVGIVASCVIQLISYKIAVIAYRKRK